MEKLSDKQERFCQEYTKDLNQTQAAIRAGYSPKTANQQASRLLTKVNVQARIAELQKKISEEIEVDANYITKGFKEVVEASDSSGSEKTQALKMLAMRLGYFEKHNAQKNPFQPEPPATKKDLPNEWK